MPQDRNAHTRFAAVWIGALLLTCGLMLLAVDGYLALTDGTIRIAKYEYFRIQHNHVLTVAIAWCSTVLGAVLLIAARRARAP